MRMMLRTLAVGCVLLVGSANAQMDPVSDMPSDVPSMAPSSMSSDVPSMVPSSVRSDIPSDMPSGGMTVPPTGMPAAAATGYECSVCMPGMILSLPNMVVEIPDSPLAPEGTQLACSLIDQGVMANPELFTEETCQQLRDYFLEPCGCVLPGETTGPAPTDPPVSDAPSDSASSTTVCTVCPAGEAITMPDAVISLPDDISITANIPFATCSLLENALADNADAIDEETCVAIQTFYAEPCGCMPLENVPNFTDPTDGTEEDLDTSMAGWKRASLAAGGATIISSIWMII